MYPRRGDERYIRVRIYWVVTNMVCASAEEVYKLEILRSLEGRWETSQGAKDGGFAEEF